jgi:hypothetical protein
VSLLKVVRTVSALLAATILLRDHLFIVGAWLTGHQISASAFFLDVVAFLGQNADFQLRPLSEKFEKKFASGEVIVITALSS